MAIPKRRVQGRLLASDGVTGLEGYVIFTPVDGNGDQLTYIKDNDGNNLLVGPVKADFSIDPQVDRTGDSLITSADSGAWYADLVVTDSPDTNPTGFGWRGKVILNHDELTSTTFELPTGDLSPLEFQSLVPNTPNPSFFGSLVTWADFDALTLEVTTAAGGAVTARTAAEAARDAAQGHATNASNSATAAANSAIAADASADAAAASAIEAATSAAEVTDPVVAAMVSNPASATNDAIQVLIDATPVTIGDITATGTPSASTYLRGDGAWASIPSPDDQHLVDAEQNVRLWQLEANILAATEGAVDWQGEGFLLTQDNVASSDVALFRKTDLDLGFAAFGQAANPVGADVYHSVPGTLHFMEYANGMFIAAQVTGSYIEVFHSVDGYKWIRKVGTTPSSTTLKGIAWNGSTYAVATSGGFVFRSSDLVTWATSIGLSASVNDIIWANSLFVAVSNGGVIHTSPDGITWTSRTTPSATPNVNCIEWSARLSLFIAGCSNGAIWTSPDGITWTARTTPAATAVYGILEANGQLLAVGGSSTPPITWTSPDGITWTAQANGLSSGTLFAVIWDGTQYVAVGNSGRHARSTTGLGAWTADTSLGTVDLKYIAYDGTIYVSSGASATVLQRSTNGSTWFDTLNYRQIYCIWNSPTIVLAGVGSDGIWYSLDDGITWTKASGITTDSVGCIIHDGTQFVATGSSTSAYTSPDGMTWTARTVPTTFTTPGCQVIWDGAKFVATRNAGFVTSADGITWTNRTTIATTTPYGLAWDGGTQYVSVGGGKVFTSTDGITWTEVTTPLSGGSALNASTNAVAYGNGVFVAAGNGKVYMSATPSVSNSWVEYTANLPAAAATGIVFLDPCFYVFSAHYVFISIDGVGWEQVATTGEVAGSSSGVNPQASINTDLDTIDFPMDKGRMMRLPLKPLALSTVTLDTKVLATAANAVYFLAEDDQSVTYEATLDGATWVAVTSGQTTALGHSGTQFGLRAKATLAEAPLDPKVFWMIGYAKEVV